MSRFNKAYEDAIGSFKIRSESWLKWPGRCKHEQFKLRDENLLIEMNSHVFPVPKELLSFLVSKCYRSEWVLAEEYPFTKIIELMKKSENISKCQIDWKKLEAIQMQELLLICLPNDVEVWKERLRDIFSEEDACSLFKVIDGKKGASGTYSRGEMIILNSDFIDSLKDCEEILEHELIHMLKFINEEEQDCSPMMEHILSSTSETETWTVNLVNALFTLYDHKMAMFSDEEDTLETRKKFLDEVVETAKSMSFELLCYHWKKYKTSKLLEDNLLFLWRILRWEPPELPEIMRKLYSEFLEE